MPRKRVTTRIWRRPRTPETVQPELPAIDTGDELPVLHKPTDTRPWRGTGGRREAIRIAYGVKRGGASLLDYGIDSGPQTMHHGRKVK